MRKIFIISIFLLSTIFTFAQKNVIKGRIIYLPLTKIYSHGLGYDRMITDDFSVQVLFNVFGYDHRDSDADRSRTYSVVPEIKYYLQRYVYEPESAFYLGIFSEVSYETMESSGMLRWHDDFLNTRERYMLNPGMLLGKNFEFLGIVSLDLYAGGKVKLVHSIEERYNQETQFFVIEDYTELGFRAGFNLGVRF